MAIRSNGNMHPRPFPGYPDVKIYELVFIMIIIALIVCSFILLCLLRFTMMLF